jgi:hypothetical protein
MSTPPSAFDSSYHLTASLCHYTRANIAFEHIVPTLKLRMNAYASMRDPFENRRLSFNGRGHPTDEADEETLLELSFDVPDAIVAVRGRMLLLSFTIDATEGYTPRDAPFMRAWARPRMSEQYADNHAGVCIALEPERTMDSLTEHLKAVGSPISGYVVYSPKGFGDTMASTLNLDSFRDDLVARVNDFVNENVGDLFFRKTLDWQTEREYRVIVYPRDRGKSHLLVPFGGAESIRAVVLGEKFPTWQIPAAKAACAVHEIELLQVAWDAGALSPVAV